jgi:predicted MFS family arabinose efflux permease
MDQGLSGSQIGIMSVAAGVCVANIYYNQPILGDIGLTFHRIAGNSGIVAVFAQAGYGLGLFFITPLGDKMNRKRLILCLQFLLIGALLCMALAKTFFLVCLMSLLTGLFAVSAQVILPMAASLEKHNRGKTVGFIFTGILIGILSARVFSGYISHWLGWRCVYGISAGLVFVVALMIYFSLPDLQPEFSGNYGQLLSSTLGQFRRFPVLRRASLMGGFMFGSFCSFWTVLTFHLGGPPLYYTPDKIGLFGILAIAGALLAPVFGKLADRKNPSRFQVRTVLLVISAVVIVKYMPFNLMALLLSVLFLDLGVQATQVMNIATIYTLDQKANSRINTVYMTIYFLGGAAGTFAGIRCWTWGGWQLVTWQLLIWALLALLMAVAGLRKQQEETLTESASDQPA